MAGVKITHPEKVLFPEDGVTKGELIDYYRRIANWMLPYLRGRPLSLQRFPDGIGAPGFFQQNADRYCNESVHCVSVPKQGGSVTHIVCDNAATLVYLANLAVITPHAWLSRFDKPNNPDQVIFDLDPSGPDFGPVKRAAQDLRRLLAEYRLPAFVKTTGSRGLHVVTALKRREDYEAVRAFARDLAERAAALAPDERTTEQRKQKRTGRVFIDTNRNAYAQTAAPAYAVRPRAGAPVSTPLDWGELDDPNLRPDGFTIRNIFGRLERQQDPWEGFRQSAASLSGAGRAISASNRYDRSNGA